MIAVGATEKRSGRFELADDGPLDREMSCRIKKAQYR